MLFQYDSLQKIVSSALQKFDIEGDVEEWALMNESSRRFITEQVCFIIYQFKKITQQVCFVLNRFEKILIHISYHILIRLIISFKSFISILT